MPFHRRSSASLILILFSILEFAACSPSSQYIQSESLLPSTRYRAEPNLPLTLCDLEMITFNLKEHDFWIRIGEGNGAIYYQGEEICSDCRPGREPSFFLGNRAYLYPDQANFILYHELEGNEIRILNRNDQTLLEIRTPPAAVSREQAASLVVDTIQVICPELPGVEDILLDFNQLPDERLSGD